MTYNNNNIFAKCGCPCTLMIDCHLSLCFRMYAIGYPFCFLRPTASHTATRFKCD